MIPLMWITR